MQSELLPVFDAPPVVEVALSIQFERLSLTSLLFGQMWDRFRDRFPRVEEQPPLLPATERFDEPTIQVEPRVQILPPQFTPRYWLLSDAGNELIQIQPDRFIFNWRKIYEDDVYPRYTMIRQRFVQELEQFQAFADEHAVGNLTVNQCEITYIDHVLRGDAWNDFGDLGRVFTFWNQETGIQDVEAVSVAIQSRRNAGDGSPIGRVYLNAQSAIRASDNNEIFALTLIGRGAPSSTATADALAMLDLEHEWLLRAFAEITTAEAQQAWGRRGA